MADSSSSEQAGKGSLGMADTGITTTITTPRPSDSTSDSLPARRSPSSSTVSQSTTAVPTLRKQLSIGKIPANTSSAGSSRNVSPTRRDAKASGSTAAQIPTQPSAAAIQRALSASNVPSLANSTPKDSASRLPRAAQLGAEEPPSWPVSPRLKSPPPSGVKRSPATANTVRKIDNGGNTTVVQSVTTNTASQSAQSPRQASADAKTDQTLLTPAKNASRGPSGKSMLATVDENSSDTAEPSHAKLQAIADLKPLTRLSDDDKPGEAVKGESGSESGGDKSDGLNSRRLSVTHSAPRRSRNSYTSLPGTKTRQTESGNMTVETETVQSIPHSGIGDRNSSNRESALRVKTSNETIRPKKERRSVPKKPRSVTGNASTKADIFEARVASAVGQADSSDSDETFVYESNPPDSRRPRHHSRTPSVTSAHSTADQRGGMRNIGDVVDERRVAGKRSMKFSNNPFNSADSPTDRQDGTVRSHPRHYGRFGRGGSHASTLDPDSPFTAASKLRNNPHSLRHSRPSSPRSPQNASLRGIAQPVFGKKRDSPFDFDNDGEDERTPLMRGTQRSLRRRHDDSESASIDEYYGVRRRGRCGPCGGCLLGVLIFMLVALSTIGFLVVSNRPLNDVHIRRIENVLAGQEELMLDLSVAAVNTNALSISIAELDVNIFAKSKYVKPDKSVKQEFLHNIPKQRKRIDDSGLDDLLPGPKKGDGKDGEEDSDASLWLLGQALKFDQALTFDGSPFRAKVRYSLGELRLAHPGNKTETGSKKWAQILEHPFDLVVRGILRYKLPVSAREEAVTVGATVLVHPEDGIDSTGRMRLEPIDHSEHWQWIDWEQEKEILEGIGYGVEAYE